MKFGTVAMALLLCIACGAPQPSILASTPAPGKTDQTVNIDPPDGDLSLEFKDVDWAPGIIGPKGASGLAEALKQKKAIMVISGQRLVEEEWEDKIFQMVKAASPETKIVARSKGILDDILLERGEIPYRKTWEVGGTDMFGRPYMIPKDHPFKTDWLSKETVLKGAEAIMVVDIIKPRDQKLREMRNARIGDCSALFESIENGILSTGDYFSPLKKQLDDILSDEFARQLKEALPFWLDEIEEASRVVLPSSQEGRCYTAYKKTLQKYKKCTQGSCELAPALHPLSGGAIGMEMSHASTIPSNCPADMGRDYVRELESLGARTVEGLLEQIPSQWAQKMIVIEAMRNLKSTMEDICAPAHRRYTQESLEKARQSVSEFVSELPQAGTEAEFTLSSGRQRVPGTGSVSVLARATEETSALKIRLANLSEQIQSMDKCRDTRRRPMQVVLVDVGTSEVYFSAIVFEEQLFCEGMAPGIQ